MTQQQKQVKQTQALSLALAAPLKIRRKPRPMYLKPERIQDMLQLLAGWELAGGRFLTRTREFPTPQVADWYGAFVGELSAALSTPAEMEVVGTRVFLRIWAETRAGHSMESATEAVLGFAQHLG